MKQLYGNCAESLTIRNSEFSVSFGSSAIVVRQDSFFYLIEALISRVWLTRGETFMRTGHHCPPGSSVLASNNERSGWPLITLAKMNLEETVGGVAGWSCARSRVHKPKSNRTLVPCGSIRVVGRIGLLAKGREGRRVVFIASKRTGRVLGSSGGLLDQSIPNIRHPLAALSYIPLSADLSTFRSEVAKSTSSVSL